MTANRIQKEPEVLKIKNINNSIINNMNGGSA